MVRSLIKDEGLMGVVELEDYEIISIDQKKDDNILGSHCKLQDGSIGEVCKYLKNDSWLVCNSNSWWCCTTEWIQNNKVKEEK